MKNKGFLFVLFLILFILVLAVILTPTPTNWNFSYSKDDKNPHGSYVLFHELNQIFDKAEITTSDSTAYTTLKNWNNDSTAYIFIGETGFQLSDELNRNALDSFVYKGNQVFLAMKYFDFWREDTSSFNSYAEVRWQSLYSSLNTKNDTLHNKLLSSSDTKTYAIRKEYATSWLIIDSTFHYKLGEQGEEHATNFIRIPHGNGNYFLYSNPGVFTNYALLNDSLANYSTALLSHMENVSHIIWDERYKPNFAINQFSIREKKSPFYFIKSNLPLHIAYWIVLTGSLLIIFIKGKREQQMIPVIKPPKNQSVLFTKTMGRFYYEKGEHYDTAQKQMIYFEHDFRNRFGIQQIDDYKNKQEELSRITTIDQEAIHQFFQKRHLLQEVNEITENQLKQISESIEQMKPSNDD